MIILPGVKGCTHLVVSSLCARDLWKQVEDLVTLTMCGTRDVPCHFKSRCFPGKGVRVREVTLN